MNTGQGSGLTPRHYMPVILSPLFLAGEKSPQLFALLRNPRTAGMLRSPKNHVIFVKAGILCVPDEQWAPAFSGGTTDVSFIPLREAKT